MQFLFFGNTSYSSASQREHAFARTLAERGYLVAFVEGMPSLASRVRSRLRRVIATESVDEHPQRKKHPVQNLTVHVPPTVPSFFRSSWVPGLDAWLFRRWFRKQFRNQNWNDTIVMVMFPYWWYGFVDKSLCPAKMFIYDICDALEMPSRNSIALRRMRMAEKKLMRDVALVTYSAFEMRTEIAKDSPSNKLLCLPNAISVFFADSMRRSSTPNRLPTIGYVGFLDPRWADRELLVRMAASFPAYRIVLRSSMDKSFSRRLKAIGNVTILPFQEYGTLAQLLSGFDIGVIPFRSNRITDVINPLKLYEYCAAGLPIVAMRTPELNHYSHILYLSDTHEEFLQNIEKALREDSETKRKERILFARNNTWESRVEELLAAITRIQDAANDIMASDKAPRPID